MKIKVSLTLLVFSLLFISATNKNVQGEEFELQLTSGSPEAMQKAMKKFTSAYPDIEVSMHALANGYGLRVGGCTEKASVEALKAKLGKEYPGATIEKCD